MIALVVPEAVAVIIEAVTVRQPKRVSKLVGDPQFVCVGTLRCAIRLGGDGERPAGVSPGDRRIVAGRESRRRYAGLLSADLGLCSARQDQDDAPDALVTLPTGGKAAPRRRSTR